MFTFSRRRVTSKVNVFLQYEKLVGPNLKTVLSLKGLHGSYWHFMELTYAKHGKRWCQGRWRRRRRRRRTPQARGIHDAS